MKRDAVSLLVRVFRLVYDNTGIYTFLAPIYYLVEGIIPAALTIFYSEFFDYAESYIENRPIDNNGEVFWQFIGILVLIYLLRIILTFAGSIAINIGIYEKLNSNLKISLANKCAKLKLIDFEDADTYNTCSRAKECLKKEQISATYMSTIMIISSGVSVIAAIGVLALYSRWIILLALVSVIPYLLSYCITGKLYYRLQKGQTLIKRKVAYLWRCLTYPTSVRELRITNSMDYVEKKWRKQNCKMQQELCNYHYQEANYMLICSIVRVVSVGVSIIFTLSLAIQGEISIGQFGACISAYVELQNKAREFFAELGKINERLCFAEDYFTFLDIKEEKSSSSKQTEFPDKIELKNVSFSYPNAGKKALKNVNINIKKGESIAIVGRNGSGKTTLTKIITGMYAPNSGTVLYDGKDLINLNTESSRKWTSLISQNFVHYFLTLRENVGISNVYQMSNDDRILECLNLSGMYVKREELNKNVGKVFGGTEYSGGEWQRIAIARALFRPAELFIMDEPTSALDPVTEADILRQFLNILREKTCIIVSHRIGLCKYVDKIIVMKNGEVVEVGSHNELYRKEGEYWKIYNSQSQWYNVDSL